MRDWYAKRSPEYKRQKSAQYDREKKTVHNRNRDARKRNAPGKHTHADVARLYDVQSGRCIGCAAPLVKSGKGKYHVDHVMPLALGGSNWPDNLQLLCPPCNFSKNDAHPDAWARERGRLFA
jgi:5-methylcytosine-specific restriction endonuclease McrA